MLRTDLGALILDFIFPRWCVGCGVEDAALCQACWKKWEVVWMEDHPVDGIDQLVSFGPYAAPFIQRVISRWKFEGDWSVAQVVAQSMASTFSNWFSQRSCLVPIPLYSLRQRERGFNQAADLAQSLAKFAQMSCAPLLGRPKQTKAQKGLDEVQKVLNMQQAFSLDQVAAQAVDRSSKLIILDDIATTGSTLREAAQVLRQAGFQHISAVVVARG